MTSTTRKLWAQTPTLGPLVDGDLCDIRIGRHYCHAEGAFMATDADGTERILCDEHARKYFPNHFAQVAVSDQAAA
jgi:hypothetical protein